MNNMNIKEFIAWLEGYIDAHDVYVEDQHVLISIPRDKLIEKLTLVNNCNLIHENMK